MILAFRNSVCNEYNAEIREYLFGKNADKFEIGDKLVFNAYYKAPKPGYPGKFISCYTCDEIKVVDVENKMHNAPFFYITPNHGTIINKYITTLCNAINRKTSRQYMIYDLCVNKIIVKDNDSDYDSDSDDVENFSITVLDDNSYHQIQKDRTSARALIRDTIQNIEYSFDGTVDDIDKDQESYTKKQLDKIYEEIWEPYYTVFFDEFANVCYGYSMTTHKSQGSTFKSVFVDVADIDRANRMKGTPNMGRKMLYTAVTRASHGLYMLH